MKLKPVNKWIQVELPEVAEQEDTVFILPEDYAKPQEQHKLVKVLSSCEEYSPGDMIIVQTHLISDVEVKGETFHFALKNHVMAIVED